MTTGSVQALRNNWYVVISYKEDNRYKTKWIPTGLDTKASKKKAQKMIPQIINEYCNSQEQEKSSGDSIMFSDYIKQWLERQKPYLADSTYSGYRLIVNEISSYFEPKGIMLKDLTENDINGFYDYKLQTVKPNTVLHFHANISKALRDAYKQHRIDRNPMDFVEKPKSTETTNNFYTAEELKRLLSIVQGDVLDVCVNLAVKYGLRRSEVLGLKWDAIDFDNNTISIQHKIVEIDGEIKGSDVLKTKTSRRTLHLSEEMKDLLTTEQVNQDTYEAICGKSYNKEWDGYVCRFPTGEIISPGYVTQHFEILLRNHHMPIIRFHDLRHSCASVLINNGTDIKYLQQFLGHSTITTTANTYSHLYSDYSKGLTSCLEDALK